MIYHSRCSAIVVLVPTIRSGKLIQSCEHAIIKKREQRMNRAVLHVILVLFLAEMPCRLLVLNESYQRLKEMRINQYATPASLLLRVSRITQHRKGKKEPIFLISPENSMAVSLVEIERACSFLTLLISKTCLIEESGSFWAIQDGTCFGFGLGAATRTTLVLLKFKNKAFLCQFFWAFPVLSNSFIAAQSLSARKRRVSGNLMHQKPPRQMVQKEKTDAGLSQQEIPKLRTLTRGFGKKLN